MFQRQNTQEGEKRNKLQRSEYKKKERNFLFDLQKGCVLQNATTISLIILSVDNDAKFLLPLRREENVSAQTFCGCVVLWKDAMQLGSSIW